MRWKFRQALEAFRSVANPANFPEASDVIDAARAFLIATSDIDVEVIEYDRDRRCTFCGAPPGEPCRTVTYAEHCEYGTGEVHHVPHSARRRRVAVIPARIEQAVTTLENRAFEHGQERALRANAASRADAASHAYRGLDLAVAREQDRNALRAAVAWAIGAYHPPEFAPGADLELLLAYNGQRAKNAAGPLGSLMFGLSLAGAAATADRHGFNRRDALGMFAVFELPTVDTIDGLRVTVIVEGCRG